MVLGTNVRRARVAAGCAFALVALIACGNALETVPVSTPSSGPPSSTPVPTTGIPDREPHTLVLNATGGGALTSIKYTLDGELVQEGAVTLPWRRSLSVPADGLPHSWTLDVEYSGTENSEFELFAIYDGQVTAHSAGGSDGGQAIARSPGGSDGGRASSHSSGGSNGTSGSSSIGGSVRG